MAISSKTVTELNEAIQSIPLPEIRIQELPVELNQFLAAAVGNRKRLEFDVDPNDFHRALSTAKA